MRALATGVSSSKTGKEKFMYTVDGTAEELAAFQESQGEFYAETKDGLPCYWSNIPPLGESHPAQIVTNKDGETYFLIDIAGKKLRAKQIETFGLDAVLAEEARLANA